MSAHAHLRRRRALIVGAVLAAALPAACGPLPPEAPVAAASSVSTALSSINSACGEAYRLQAFHPRADLSVQEKTASSSAIVLGRLSRRHPAWIYQSKSLAQLDSMSANYLQACSLRRAARVLLQASR
jgi:hypothetical protein